MICGSYQKMQKQKNFPFTKNETILQRTETKQSNHSAIWNIDIHQNRKIEQINNFLPCSSWVKGLLLHC